MIQKSFTITQPVNGDVLSWEFNPKLSAVRSPELDWTLDAGTEVSVFSRRGSDTPSVLLFHQEITSAECMADDQYLYPQMRGTTVIPADELPIDIIEVSTVLGHISYSSPRAGGITVLTTLYDHGQQLQQNTQSFSLDTQGGHLNPPALQDIVWPGFSVRNWTTLQLDVTFSFIHPY